MLIWIFIIFVWKIEPPLLINQAARESKNLEDMSWVDILFPKWNLAGVLTQKMVSHQEATGQATGSRNILYNNGSSYSFDKHLS